MGRWYVWVCSVFLIFATFVTSAPAQEPQARIRAGLTQSLGGGTQERVSELVCSMSAFFTINPEEVFRSRAHILDGRGLIVCKNDQGFTTELPVMLEADLLVPDWPTSHGDVAISLNTSPFVVPRETSQLQDVYLTKQFATFGETGGSDTHAEPQTLMRGLRHDLLIELKLTSKTSSIAGVRLTNLRLKIDDDAPDLF
jgi:hypothetical protein